VLSFVNQSTVIQSAGNQSSGRQWSKNVALAFFTMALILLLHACGFQLRGAINLSDDMSPIYIEKNSFFDLAREIKDVLSSNAIKMAGNASSSKSQLLLLKVDKSRRVLSVDGDGRVREYLLTYRVNFEIKRKSQTEDKFESKRDSISISRSILFEPDAVLGVINESEAIYKDMQHEAAGLILLKLQSFSGQMKQTEQKAEAAGMDDGSSKVVTSQENPATAKEVSESDEPEKVVPETIEPEKTEPEKVETVQP
jgi:LPS-assembly lipoprotein